MNVRSTAKAILIDRDKVLLNRCRDRHNGEYYTLPGGGQQACETLDEALVRECREETGYTVTPQRFAALIEEICDDPDFRETHPQYVHKMLHIFVCTLASAERLPPTEEDSAQIASEWVDFTQLPGIRLLPEAVGQALPRMVAEEGPLFLGSWHVAHNHG
jgi:ADP-ribose pyrophosphatase YjhB (NUDIX family)